MDPLGLALENFNALGMWRESERKVPIDSAGTLVTGEPFKGVKDLKHILTTTRREEGIGGNLQRAAVRATRTDSRLPRRGEYVTRRMGRSARESALSGNPLPRAS